MQKIPLEIIMPIYNEGDKVIKLLNLFHASVKTQFRLLLCYDSDDDNIFELEPELLAQNTKAITDLLRKHGGKTGAELKAEGK